MAPLRLVSPPTTAMARYCRDMVNRNWAGTTVRWSRMRRVPPSPATTPATAKATSLYRTTSTPSEVAASSDPRMAKKARPVLVSRRFDSRATMTTITASIRKYRTRRLVKSKYGKPPGIPRCWFGRVELPVPIPSHDDWNRNWSAIHAKISVATAR